MPRSPTTSAKGTSVPSASSRCSGWRTAWMNPCRTTCTTTISKARGRRASGSWSVSPAGLRTRPLIRRAARMATRRGGDLLAVHVIPEDGSSDAASLDATRRLVEMVGGSFHEVVGRNMPDALLDFARAENITQVVLGASNRHRWQQLLRPSVINRVIRDSGPVDVHVISMEAHGAAAPPPGGADRRAARSAGALGGGDGAHGARRSSRWS